MILMADLDGDGQVSFDEFFKLISSFQGMPPPPNAAMQQMVGRGLHSSTLQLNLSTFCVTGGAVRGCFGGV